MSDSGGKLKRPGGPSADPKTAGEGSAYLPPGGADHSPKAGYARVIAQRSEAASQISRSLRVWRKADEGAEAKDAGEEKTPDESAEKESDEADGGAKEEKENEKGEEGKKDEASGKAEEGQKGEEAQEPAPKVAAKKIFRQVEEIDPADVKEVVPGITYSGRNIVVVNGQAYYQSSGQANTIPGAKQKPVGAWFQIWGCQEQPTTWQGQDVPEGWIMKQTYVHTSLVSGPDMAPYEVEYGPDMGSSQQVNAWLRAHGVPALKDVHDSDPSKKK